MGQSTQVLDDVEPIAELYFPFMHETQKEAPGVEYVPARQVVHMTAPVEPAYVPARHKTQPEPLGE